jgi:hypothetical protein
MANFGPLSLLFKSSVVSYPEVRLIQLAGRFSDHEKSLLYDFDISMGGHCGGLDYRLPIAHRRRPGATG